ncbi:hypothetical protein [Cyclobacterium marinum]|uniref:Uncharacterized protein n=1 Tax=Cyclobacterium marinum (strain ATCC 25205 / DSM 745 / LMG 13164 / NCIMB 1802) TaxID=880070 RepID=G0IXZ8_CYCMS|nr:hypothetical protein [Cyclobacterium marinum]AEL24331.1 hypothetical protein Cycma_0556 [Cyclobacterium marinum DSM 745]
MRLKEYNKATALQRAVASEASVTINRKTGLVSFNQASIKQIGLRDGQLISFYQDEENPIKWYFFYSENGFRLRLASGGNMRFGCKHLAGDILKSLEVSDNKVTIPIANKRAKEYQEEMYILDTFKVNQKFKSENVKPKRF